MDTWRFFQAHRSGFRGERYLKPWGMITRSLWFVMSQTSPTAHKRAGAPLRSDEVLFINVGIWISHNFHMLRNSIILWFFSHIQKQVLACLGLKSVICRPLVQHPPGSTCVPRGPDWWAKQTWWGYYPCTLQTPEVDAPLCHFPWCNIHSHFSASSWLSSRWRTSPPRPRVQRMLRIFTSLFRRGIGL